MSTTKQNYVLLKIPIEDADHVFDAICHNYGITTTETNQVEDGGDENGQTIFKIVTEELDKETCARKALISVVQNAVINYENMLALQEAEANRTVINIS